MDSKIKNYVSDQADVYMIPPRVMERGTKRNQPLVPTMEFSKKLQFSRIDVISINDIIYDFLRLIVDKILGFYENIMLFAWNV